MDVIDEDTSRVRSGLLPVFFAFNVKSPAVGGLTGTGCNSFAPAIQTDCSKNPFNDEGTGAEIDMRDVRLGTLDPLLSTIFGGNASLGEQQVWTVGAITT